MTIQSEIARIARLSNSSVSDSRIAAQARANVAQFNAESTARNARLAAGAADTAQAHADFLAADIANGWHTPA